MAQPVPTVGKYQHRQPHRQLANKGTRPIQREKLPERGEFISTRGFHTLSSHSPSSLRPCTIVPVGGRNDPKLGPTPAHSFAPLPPFGSASPCAPFSTPPPCGSLSTVTTAEHGEPVSSLPAIGSCFSDRNAGREKTA